MRSRKILAGLAIVAAGAAIGTDLLFAQKDDGAGPKRDEMHAMMEGTSYPWLGVELKDVTPEQARELKLGEEYGAVVDKVDKVEADSPAAKTGLETGDVIVEFAGEKVRSVAELRRLVEETPLGRTVEIRIRRNGEKKTLSATLEARPDTFGPLMSRLRDRLWPEVNMPMYDFPFNFGGTRLGITADRLTPQLAQYFGVKGGKGVLVREVEPGSAAEKAGLKAGDCIVQVDSTPVESVMGLHRALAAKPAASREVTLTIVRDHQQQTVKVQLEGRQSHGRNSQSGTAMASPGMTDLDNLENEVRALAPSAAAEVQQQARELARQLAHQASELREEAQEAAREARQAHSEILKHHEEWRSATML